MIPTWDMIFEIEHQLRLISWARLADRKDLSVTLNDIDSRHEVRARSYLTL